MEIKDSGRVEAMKGTYGYCQIHNIEGLVKQNPAHNNDKMHPQKLVKGDLG